MLSTRVREGEARELVRESFDTKRYQPQNPSAWSEPAERFAKL